MDIRFDDQVVLITGASTGIGAALARAFGTAGAKVVVHYNRSPDQANEVVQDIEQHGGKALGLQADLTQADQLKKLAATTLSTFGKVDVLINNAGGLVERVPIAQMSDETFEQVIDLNLTQVFQLCRALIPAMQKQGHGNIINVTSIAARNGGGSGAVAYATSKGAISTFTHGLAKELIDSNIRVNALSPGVILTPFHERYTDATRMEAMVKTIPMNRAGEPEECVGTVFYLASDMLSRYVTGQVIEVNGGQYMP